MKKAILAAAVVASLLFGFVASAGAQDASITVDPESVEAAGEATFTVTGTGFTENGFVLPCPGANADLTQLAAEACDLGNLAPYEIDDAGGFTVEVTFDIPDIGLLIVAGNVSQTEVAPIVITVGAADDTLANTGANTQQLIIVMLGVLVAGIAVLAGGRRLGRA